MDWHQPQEPIKELKFLGHTISADGVRPDLEKVRAIIKAPVPQEQAQLRSFLGSITYISCGLGCVILQEVDNQLRPVAYASQNLINVEKRYAQIEREAQGVL